MMEMFGKLHQAYRKVVDIEESGRRYLGTYFRVAFYGRVCLTASFGHTSLPPPPISLSLSLSAFWRGS